MSYVKTVWVNEQTPLNAENLNHMEEGIFNATEGVDQGAAVRSIGRDTLVQKTVNIPEDVDDEGHQIDRTNVAEGAFSAVFRSRNITGEKASESLVVGGLNKDYGQDNGIFGYRCEAYANQGFTGGYRAKNYGSESIQVGNQLTINGTITEDEDGNPKSDSRYNAQFGKSNTMGTVTVGCFMAGESISQGNGGLYNDITGKGHQIDINLKYSRIGGWNSTIGKSCDDIDVFGYGNTVGKYIQNSFVSGKQNTITDGTSSSKKNCIYILGEQNTNNGHNNIHLLGKGLNPVEDGQVIIGQWNKGTENCWFEVGCGTGSSSRGTAFAVCQQGNNKWVKVGNASLTESDVSDMATKTFVSSIVGDINSVLDTINGQVI